MDSFRLENFLNSFATPENKKHSDTSGKKLTRIIPRIRDGEQEENIQGDKGVCTICAHRRVRTVCVPCGHAMMCAVCSKKYANEVENWRCPMCNKDIEKVIRLYTE